MKAINFEKSLLKLEKIVEDLEEGKLPLEDAIKKFEEGIKIAKACENKLDETNKKIDLLMSDKKGNVTRTPFKEEEDDDDEFE